MQVTLVPLGADGAPLACFSPLDATARYWPIDGCWVTDPVRWLAMSPGQDVQVYSLLVHGRDLPRPMIYHQPRPLTIRAGDMLTCREVRIFCLTRN